MIMGRQIRKARDLLGWSDAELSERAGVEVSTVRRLEAADEEPLVTSAEVATVRSVLEEAGIIFAEDDAGVWRAKAPPA